MKIMLAYIIGLTLAFAGMPEPRSEVSGLLRLGPPAREFVAEGLVPDWATAPIGAEFGLVWLRHRSLFAFRPSVSLEGWTRRWHDEVANVAWGQEFGLRIEPRFAVRFILARRSMWTYRWSFVPTIDVGVGAALVLFMDGAMGWAAASPTVSARPALHFGRRSTVFVGLDLRAGFHTSQQACYPGRARCPETYLNPGGTSVGLVVGGTVPNRRRSRPGRLRRSYR